MYSLYACLALLRASCHVRAENNVLKKIDLVDVLKQDLRRNNDDYAEMEKNELLNSNKTSSTAATIVTGTDVPRYGKEVTARDTNDNTRSGVERRADGGRSWQLDYEIKTATSRVDKKSDNIGALSKPLRMGSIKKPAVNHERIKSVNHIKRNISGINIRNEISLPKLKPKNDPISIPNPSRGIHNKKRIDKFKKFVSKLKELSSKVETQTRKLELAGANNLRTEAEERAADRADAARALPAAAALDMAPAKGGRVRRLRVKGRLCHRHVLLPEGPKYDSAGRWYVPEHRLVARHAYDGTRPPRLLLPRCCNCCKKSVLGCE